MRMEPQNRPGTPINLRGGTKGRVRVHPDNPADANLARFLQDVLNHRMFTPAQVIERYGLPTDRHQGEPD